MWPFRLHDEEATWSFWQTPISEAQRRLLQFRSKAVPSLAENCTLLEKQLLMCSWALVEKGHLAIGLTQVTRPPDFSIMHSALVCTKSSRTSSSASSGRGGTTDLGSKRSREHKKTAWTGDQTSYVTYVASYCCNDPSNSVHTIRQSSWPVDGEGGTLSLVHEWVCSVCWCKLKMDANSLETHWERQEWWKFSQRAKLQAAHLVIHFEKRKKWTPRYSLIGWGKWTNGLVIGLAEARFNDWGYWVWSGNCHWMYDLSTTGISAVPSIQETSQPLGPAEVLWSRAIRVQSKGGSLWVSVKASLSTTAGTLGSTVCFSWIITTSVC